jgi:GxxExxY protein
VDILSAKDAKSAKGPMSEAEENRIGAAIVDSAVAVHSILGPGLLERTYELCLAHELTGRDFRVARQVRLPLRYRDLIVEDAYKVDLLVDELVVVEVKAIETVLPVHKGQLLSYLRLGNFKLGFLMNFNVARMREGMTRLVNGL